MIQAELIAFNDRQMKKLRSRIYRLRKQIKQLQADNKKQAEALERYDKMWRAEQKSAASLWAEKERLKRFIQDELDSMRNLVASLEKDPPMRPFAQILKGKIIRYRQALKGGNGKED